MTTDEETPTIGQFAEELVREPKWYTLGIILDLPTYELDTISQNHGSDVMRCYIEMYKQLENEGKRLTWKSVVDALRKMNSNSLAENISFNHVVSPAKNEDNAPNISSECEEDISLREVDMEVTKIPHHEEPRYAKVEVPSTVAQEFDQLSVHFTKLVISIRRVFRESQIDISDLQNVIEVECGLEPICEEDATVNKVFDRLSCHYSLLSFRILRFLVATFLSGKKGLQTELMSYSEQAERFKSSAKMKHLVHLLKNKQSAHDEHRTVKLKVREFWSNITLKKFEKMLKQVLAKMYDYTSHIVVTDGCICVTWIVPEVYTLAGLPQLSLEFIKIIGVVSLHVGENEIYSIPGDGCEVIEAAVLQAIELKSMKALELFLAIGCNPEIAARNETVAVTNIVNIQAVSSDVQSGIEHICLFDENKNVEAILNKDKSEDVDSADLIEKMNKSIFQENDMLRESVKIKGKRSCQFANNCFILYLVNAYTLFRITHLEDKLESLTDNLEGVQANYQKIVIERNSLVAKIGEELCMQLIYIAAVYNY